MIYLIQDARSYDGDDVIWWRPDRRGYTTNFDEAGRYSEEEAKKIVSLRDTDIAIPLFLVQQAATKIVRRDALDQSIYKSRILNPSVMTKQKDD